MMARRWAPLVALVLAIAGDGGCATRLLDEDRARSADPDLAAAGAVADGSAGDAAAAAGPGVICGPNQCRGSEVCCDPVCGVCGFPGECADLGCAGP